MRGWQPYLLLMSAFLVPMSRVHAQSTTQTPPHHLWLNWRRPVGPPCYTMKQVGHMIDCVEDDIRDDGFVAVKHPDVWGQARMTKYRVDFENGMVDNTTKFESILSAAVLRADQASFEQATALGASLSPGGGARPPPSLQPTRSRSTPPQRRPIPPLPRRTP
jgi:hypothetical protein